MSRPLERAMPTLTPDDDRPAVELDRPAQLGGQSLGGVGRVGDARDRFEEDRELVAALASGDVAGPDRAAQAMGDLDEEPVAGPVAERVVDDLEVVEVEEQHRDVRAAPPAALERPFEVLAEEDAVGQPGQRVVEGVVEELRLEPLVVGRVDEQALRDAGRSSGPSFIAYASSRSQTSDPSRANIRYSARRSWPPDQCSE